MDHPLTHLDTAGHARMVDVTDKQPTIRSATAAGRVVTSAETVALLRDGTVPKGDVLAVARIAGIQAAKKTPELLPLAHVIGVHGAVVGAHDRHETTADVGLGGLTHGQLVEGAHPHVVGLGDGTHAAPPSSSTSMAAMIRSLISESPIRWTMLLKKPRTTRRRASSSGMPRACR